MYTSNQDIAHLLRSVAAAYELKGFNRFRRIAYEQAADAVEHFNREIYDVWKNGELEKIDGIGLTLSAHLNEYFSKKGSDETYIIRQIKDFPPAVFELMKVPGLGAKRAFRLCQEFAINSDRSSAEQLLKIAETGKIAPLEGFGEKSQSAIIMAIKTYLQEQDTEVRMPLAYATSLAKEIIDYLKTNRQVKIVEALGSLRRQVATIGDIDLVVVANPSSFSEIIKHFIAYPGRVKTETQGDKKASMTVAGGRDVDLRVSEPDSFGAMLQYFTGSKAHNIRLREYALKKGYSLNEFGIKDVKTGRRHIFKTEEEFYHFLRLSYIPPEIREGTDEVEKAVSGRLPTLVKLSDIRGDLQMHSDFDIEPSHDSGVNSVEELIEKARTLGYDYIAITDHNPSQANHTDRDIITIMKKRYEYMTQFKKKFNVIISCEVDIMPQGGIALPGDAYDFVDMLLVSIHSSFRQPKDTMTKRILSALTLPKVRILGHPTGRLLGKRQEIEADWPVIFRECKKRNIAVEINSWPERLDLPDILVKQAKDMGVLFSLGTDAHAVEHLENMPFAVSVARRGWLEKNDIINTRPWIEVKKWIV